MPKLALEKTVWLFPAAVIAHNIEEAVWLPAFWARYHMAAPYTPLVFRVLTLVVDLAAVASGYWFARSPGHRPAAWVLASFLLFLWLNVFWHIGVALHYRAYAPGVVTGVAINLPLFSYLLARVYRERIRSASHGQAQGTGGTRIL